MERNALRPSLRTALTLARVLNTSVEQLFPKPLAPIESPGADQPAAPPAPGVACDALPQPEVGDARAACPACGAAVEAGR